MSSISASISPSNSMLRKRDHHIDSVLLLATLSLLAIGLLMVSSASITIADRNFDAPFHYFLRQAVYVALGLGLGLLVTTISLEHWERYSPLLLVIGILLLVMVLVPGIGHEVNGSHRWISLGIMNLQASELVKLFVIIYMAGYLVRRAAEVRETIGGFLKPFSVLILISVLLVIEPDLGSTVVIMATALGMMFLAGVPLSRFAVMIAVVLAVFAALTVFEPYRMARLTSFMNPWADPFDSGFQLTQALIAFGRGEWFGVGLGGSIQKLFYLPEAHTDFVFAVLSEELGLVGGAMVTLLFGLLVWRAFRIGAVAMSNGQRFAGHLAFGLGLWIGLQAFINIGVNMGVLPTKGLTLPLMSYGGSSIVVMCIAVALLLRVHYETTQLPQVERRKVPRK